MSGRELEYADVAGMFRHLAMLEVGSAAFLRQREVIIRRCMPLADHIARRYGGRGEPHDDLVQAARVGLVNAVNRFELTNGADFASFAVPTIMGEVRRHFRDYGWAVKVPRRMKELRAQLTSARGELSQQLGRAPNASEIAEHLGIDREWVIEPRSPALTIRRCQPTGGQDQTTSSLLSVTLSAMLIPAWIRCSTLQRHAR